MTDLQTVRELSREAKDVLDSPAVIAAFAKMKTRMDGELLQAKSTDEILDLVSQLKVLHYFKAELKALVDDYSIQARRHA